jgi:hypothetical protein
MSRTDYIIGLDLGQQQDYSAVAVVERTLRESNGRTRGHYVLGHLHRWPLGTGYAQILEEVTALARKEPLVNPTLAVDSTGVGKAVVEMFDVNALPARLVPVLITGGHQVTRGEKGGWHVPKKELVSALQSTLQGGRLEIAKLPLRDLLVKEMHAFKAKITVAGNETFEAWRERDHDDTVLAAAITVWVGEQLPTEPWRLEVIPHPDPEPGWLRDRAPWWARGR